ALYLQLGAHRLHELATNREAEAGAGEVVAQVRRALAERLVQGLEGTGVVPAARVAHRELEPVPVEGTRRDLDGARIGELDGVGRQSPGRSGRAAAPPPGTGSTSAGSAGRAPSRPPARGPRDCSGTRRGCRAPAPAAGSAERPSTRGVGPRSRASQASLASAKALGSGSPASASGGVSTSRSTTQPAVGLRCNPWRSIMRYSVVRSTPATRAAFDILPAARF